MEHLIFILNATVSVFCLVLLGMTFGITGILNCSFVDRINHFAFNISLLTVLWRDLPGIDFLKVQDGESIGFCFIVTTASILTVTTASMFPKEREVRGELIQTSCYSSAALLEIAFVQSTYGNPNMAPLVVIGCVPLYNIVAAVILEMIRPGRGRINKGLLIKTLAGILHNPIPQGIICGMAWSASGIPRPTVLVKVTGDVAALTTPLELLTMDAFFDLGQAGRNISSTLSTSLTKLVGLESIIIPAAIAAGFKREALTAISIMLGLATTFGAFVMAKSIGYDGDLTSNTVMITTCGCAMTSTIGFYILKSLNLV